MEERETEREKEIVEGREGVREREERERVMRKGRERGRQRDREGERRSICVLTALECVLFWCLARSEALEKALVHPWNSQT